MHRMAVRLLNSTMTCHTLIRENTITWLLRKHFGANRALFRDSWFDFAKALVKGRRFGLTTQS